MLHSARVALFLYEKAHRSNWAATKGSLLGSQPPSGVGDSTPKIQADIEGLPSQWGWAPETVVFDLFTYYSVLF